MGSLKDFKKKTPDYEFLSIEEGGSAQVQFLSELKDFEYLVEHSAPKNWRKHSICTYDTGQCYPCEQQLRDWNQKVKIFMPVLHDGKFKVMSSGLGVNAVVHHLQNYLKGHGTIMDTQFIITRNGKGKRTKYEAFPVAESAIMVYNGDTSLQKLKESMDYSKQANYYK